MDDLGTIFIHELKFTKNTFFNYVYIYSDRTLAMKIAMYVYTQVYLFLLENIKNWLKIIKVALIDKKKCSQTIGVSMKVVLLWNLWAAFFYRIPTNIMQFVQFMSQSNWKYIFNAV